MLDPVGELAARIATPAGPRLELGTVQQPPVGGTVLVVTADQAWTCILPSSIPVPAVGAVVKVRVEGNIRTVQEIYGPAAAPAVPVGTIVDFIGATPPTGWLACNGATFSAATYPELAAVLGGTTLPDARGRFRVGASTTYPLKSTGGAAAHSHTLQVVQAFAADITQSATYAATTGANDYLPPYLATTVIIRATP